MPSSSSVGTLANHTVRAVGLSEDSLNAHSMRARRGSAVLLRVVVINSSTLGLWTMTTTLTKGQKQMEKALLSHAHKKDICEDRVLLLSQLVLRAENSGCFYWTHKRGTHEQKTGKPTLGFCFFKVFNIKYLEPTEYQSVQY